jgi:hypothetical protein
MARITSQADQRRGYTYTDQHGRKWYAEIEKVSGAPCTSFQPQFLAPILPPKKYVREDPVIPGRVVIHYNEWIKVLQTRDQEWFREAQIVGAAEHKENFDPNAPMSQTILNKMGARPRVPRCITPLRSPVGDAALPAIAARGKPGEQGNLWILGLLGPNGETPKQPASLAPFFVRPDFVLPTFTDEFEDTVSDEPKPAKVEPSHPKQGHAGTEALARYRAQQKALREAHPVAVGE